jgi:hypothetical protein
MEQNTFKVGFKTIEEARQASQRRLAQKQKITSTID